MKCSKCGNEIIQGQTVCPICGASIVSELESNDNQLIQNNESMTQDNSFVSNQVQNSSELGLQDNYNNTSIDSQSINNVVSDQNLNNYSNQNSINSQLSDSTIQSNDFMNNQVMDSQPVNQTAINANDSINSINTNQNNSRKKSKLIIIIGIVAVLLIGVVVSCLILFKKVTKPKNIFTRALDKVANAAMLPVTNDNDRIYEKMSISFNISSSDNSIKEIGDILNKFKLSMDASIDYSNKTLSANLLTNYNGNKLLEGDIYGENNQLYVYSSDLYDKYVKVPADFSELMEKNSVDSQAYQDVITEIKDALKNTLKDEYFKSSKEKITINGKEISTNRNELMITKDNLKNMKKDFVNYLINSKKFTSAMSKLVDKKEDEIKEGLNSISKEKNDLKEIVNSNYSIIIYTKGTSQDFVRLSLVDNNLNSSLELTKISDESYDISLNYGTLKYSIGLTITGTENNKTYVFKYSDGNNSFEVKIDNEVSYDREISKPNISNSINIETLTEEELATILGKLQSNKALNEFIEDIQKISYFNNLSISNNNNSVDYSNDLFNNETNLNIDDSLFDNNTNLNVDDSLFDDYNFSF